MKNLLRLIPIFGLVLILACGAGSAFGQGNSGSNPEFVLFKYYNSFPGSILPITNVYDSLGTIYFKAKPINGSPFRTGVSIQSLFEGPTTVDSLNATLVFRTGAVKQRNRMAITSQGLVGIGTLTPQFNLHTVGNTHTTGEFWGRIHFDKNQLSDDAPNTYIDESYFELKRRSVLSVPGMGLTKEYGGLLTLGPGEDSYDHQLFFGEDGIYTRRDEGNDPSWSEPWYKMLTGEDINGDPNYIAKFTGPHSLGNSQLWNDGVQVGIGTAAPTAGYFLDINGNTRVGGNFFGTGTGHFGGKVTIGTINTPAMLGVVNTSAYNLYVEGGILTEEVLVRTGWADYVFNKNYHLNSLDQVAQHIEQKGHLPGMPSAAQVEQEGLKLAENAVNQQVKIEELFLYLIQMDKEVKALKAENAELREKVTQLEKR